MIRFFRHKLAQITRRRSVTGYNGQKSVFINGCLHGYTGNTPVGKKVPRKEYRFLRLKDKYEPYVFGR